MNREHLVYTFYLHNDLKNFTNNSICKETPAYSVTFCSSCKEIEYLSKNFVQGDFV